MSNITLRIPPGGVGPNITADARDFSRSSVLRETPEQIIGFGGLRIVNRILSAR